MRLFVCLLGRMANVLHHLRQVLHLFERGEGPARLGAASGLTWREEATDHVRLALLHLCGAHSMVEDATHEAGAFTSAQAERAHLREREQEDVELAESMARWLATYRDKSIQ